MTATVLRIKQIIDTLNNTKDPAEFMGATKQIQLYIGEALELLLNYKMFEFLLETFLNFNLSTRFIVNENVFPAGVAVGAQAREGPQLNLVDRIHLACLEVISLFLTYEVVAKRFCELLKNEHLRLRISLHIVGFYEYKDSDYRTAAVIFTQNLTLYIKELIERLNLLFIIGDFNFTCLDEKNMHLVKHKINGAINYYGVDKCLKNLRHFFVEVDKRKCIMSRDVLIYVHNIIDLLLIKLNNTDINFANDVNKLLQIKDCCKIGRTKRRGLCHNIVYPIQLPERDVDNIKP
jgi:hypothetical protein